MKPTQQPLALLLLLATAGGAIAQTPVNCRSIVSSTERLACYDQANGAPEVNTTSTASATTTTTVAASTEVTPAQVNAPAPASTMATAQPTSIIDAAWGFDPSSDRYQLGMYNSNYLLLGRYSDNPNDAPYQVLQSDGKVELDSIEAKFQLSFKGRIWTTDDRRWGVWGAYTQNNNWQVYNADQSRPFRETNYMPELIVSFRPDVDLGAGFKWKLLNAGYAHQSNGRTESISRSWDRLFAEVGIENGNFAIYGKAWYRLPESDDVDENATILDYYGRGQLNAVYRWNGHSFTALARGNFNTGKGSLQVGWYSPPVIGPLRAYVQGFTGYGETMIDYNWRQNTIGAGFALNDGF
ncbi:phospholipase A [Deefgea tanakiae]|uniref:Phospholipase A1 n=1 Tax=Deefgea tanakiae TaxID=2865840 RepID=A0ABX8Z8J8_9NEIS|nr:phospholipase A [Deefgea tanakiae]QZA77224.1 phospholipase A [Deefgea tanakiae]